VKLPGRSQAPEPSPRDPGQIVVIAAGSSTAYKVRPGQQLVIGRDSGASIVLDDPGVSPGHISVTRFGPGWLVQSLDPANPALILDPTGRAQPILKELGLRSGELLAGGCQILLYPPAPEPPSAPQSEPPSAPQSEPPSAPQPEPPNRERGEPAA